MCKLFCSDDTSEKNDSVDGYAFRCFNKTCTRYRTHKSIRCESFLDDFNIDLKKFIYFVYLYSKEESCETITETIGISSSMLYRMISKLRSKITSYFLNNPIILGGPSVLVQIDESKFNFNVKSHRGHAPRAPIWVFGIVDTSFSPARGFMKVVERRDKRTLMSIITSHVRPGTIIHSDEWPAYNEIASFDYEHGTVNHKHHFINPYNNVHTQHVESYWNRQKLRIKKSKGVKKTVIESVLNEYMFRDFFK